jgi:hypothetical protein
MTIVDGDSDSDGAARAYSVLLKPSTHVAQSFSES